MRNVQDGRGSYPMRYFYDTNDIRRVGGFPLPGLRTLTWPDPEEVLPPGIAAQLLEQYPQIAAEATALARSGAIGGAGDAYPEIAKKSQWNKLVLYTAAGGWDEDLCHQMPTVCNMLKGKLRSEHEPYRGRFATGLFVENDEAVIVFRIAAGGMAHLHNGQDARINCHLCLLNCDGAALVAAGSIRNYSDSSLFAFEDRVDHEIINVGTKDRISLTIGVLHPDLIVPEYPSPHSLLGYAMSTGGGSNATASDPLPAATLNPLMVLSAYYGYHEIVDDLLNQGAEPNWSNIHGAPAVHAACMGIGRTNDNSTDLSGRSERALATIAVLAKHVSSQAIHHCVRFHVVFLMLSEQRRYSIEQ